MPRPKAVSPSAKTPAPDWLGSLVVPEALVPGDYEYPLDRRALETFQSIPGAGWLVGKFLDFVMEFGHSDLLGQSVRVSPKQFPRIHALASKTGDILHLKPPPVFILENPRPNAYAMGSGEEKAFVVLTRRLIEVLDERELFFVLGHEFAHVKSQHILYHTLAIYLANAGLFAGRTLPWIRLLSIPAQLALNAWARRSEISCDRAGLVACQDLKVAQKAVLTISCGSKELADQVDLKEYLRQDDDLKKTHGRFNELLSTHPYMPKRLRCLKLFADGEFFVRHILRRAEKGYLLPSRLDEAVGQILAGETPRSFHKTKDA